VQGIGSTLRGKFARGFLYRITLKEKGGVGRSQNGPEMHHPKQVAVKILGLREWKTAFGGGPSPLGARGEVF